MGNEYKLKNFKSFMGEDAPGFTASLYKENHKIGFVADYGNGCPITYRDISDKEMDILKIVANENSVDTFICMLADEYETNKKFKKWCKTKVVFILNNDEVYTVKCQFDKRVKDFLINKYGDSLKEIVNERYL